MAELLLDLVPPTPSLVMFEVPHAKSLLEIAHVSMNIDWRPGDENTAWNSLHLMGNCSYCRVRGGITGVVLVLLTHLSLQRLPYWISSLYKPHDKAPTQMESAFTFGHTTFLVLPGPAAAAGSEKFKPRVPSLLRQHSATALLVSKLQLLLHLLLYHITFP